MHEIRNDRPIPQGGSISKGGRYPFYPFGAMHVGESFVVPKEQAHNMARAASAYGKRNSKKFTTRLSPDGSRTCWRIE